MEIGRRGSCLLSICRADRSGLKRIDQPTAAVVRGRLRTLTPGHDRTKLPSVAAEIDIFCMACGYALRGLSGRTCPECGRAFDPADPATVTTVADSRRRRRQRWLRWAAIGLAAAGFVYAVAPRGIGTWEISIYCEDCGQMLITRRLQLIAPAWLAVRYPGLNRPLEVSNVRKGPMPAGSFPFPPPNWQPRCFPESCTHRWAQVRAHTPAGSAGACACSPAHGVAITDQLLTPASLPAAVYDWADPHGQRRRIHCLPLRATASASSSDAGR